MQVEQCRKTMRIDFLKSKNAIRLILPLQILLNKWLPLSIALWCCFEYHWIPLKYSALECSRTNWNSFSVWLRHDVYRVLESIKFRHSKLAGVLKIVVRRVAHFDCQRIELLSDDSYAARYSIRQPFDEKTFHNALHASRVIRFIRLPIYREPRCAFLPGLWPKLKSIN